jgi:hypothetical protein
MSYLLSERANRIKDLKVFERAVLHNLAWRANRFTGLSYPSVERIALETSVSVRQVFRALVTLKQRGLIKFTGRTPHGVAIYLVVIPDDQMSHSAPTGSSHHATTGEAHLSHLADAACHPDMPTLPSSHPNLGIEPGKLTEEVDTSPEQGLAHTSKPETTKQAGKDQPQTPDQQNKSHGAAKVAGGANGDSKVVAAWKTAHASAGIPYEVTAVIGKQLGSLAKGDKAIAYNEVLSVLIPIAVAEWDSMCQYLAMKYGINFFGKKSLPKVPHAGFLLAHRKAAYDYCSKDADMRQMLCEVYKLKPQEGMEEELLNPAELGL